MSKPDFKTALAAYKSYVKMPKTGDAERELIVMGKLFLRVEQAAKRENINLTKDHLNCE